MQFIKNGPSIPGELLIARDEGRVVFFCGAGVSRARARLPDFFGLADSVTQALGVPADNPVRKILKEASEIDRRTGVSGLISADRVFGILERDFLAPDIELEVAKALQPPPDVDLSAHRILLDLATTPEGKMRLVTTNFDRLFEDCNDTARVWQPPRLPDPSRPSDLDGIVHLHGRATEDYTGSEGDPFVLSSSEFGRAYLSDGWATRFFKEIVDRYFVVFVGYQADDPPVQYLLEALNKELGQLDGVYAFQSGASIEASARWSHKGVEAIAYVDDEEHRALWKTLEAWAERAKAPEEWYKSVIDLARKGPEQLQPHERGQVAHIVSTLEGARKFSEGDSPPPAEWLCVFDPNRRYAKPGRVGGLGEQGLFVDPFELYRLDSDEVPKKIGPKDYYDKREVPPKAWDGFSANRLDRQNLRDDSFFAVRGYWAANPPKLPSRLGQIGAWISKVAHQPASVWWAAHQNGLHPDIQQQIQWQLERSQKDASPVMRQAWRYLFEVWEEKRGDAHRDWYKLKAVIDKDGWDSGAIRRYAAIDRPYLKVERNYWSGPKPPEWKKDTRVRDLLLLDVEYPNSLNDAIIPDEWLALAVRELRKNLEHALLLETELGGYGLSNISPIFPDDRPDDDQYGRTHGLSRNVIKFSSLFERFTDLDVAAACQEFLAWPVNDDAIFGRLRIWVCGNAKLISAQAFGGIFAGLSDIAFWNPSHQRDLLLVLANRWQELSDNVRKEIEDRLLKGSPGQKDGEDSETSKRRAWLSLNRITWLASNGCDFAFDIEAETENLRSIAPEWKSEFAKNTAESTEGRGGWVKTETEHSLLLEEPPSSILSKARELSGRTEDFLVENDPFAGLSADHPVRAFSALTNAARRGEYPEWAWRTFLNPKARKDDKQKFSALIAERISSYPDDAVAGFIHPASDWLQSFSKTLASHNIRTFDRIVLKLVNVLRSQPPASNSAVVRSNKEPDWAMEAINAPVGKIAEALFDDPRKNDLKAGDGFPADWIAYVNNLLALHDDLSRYALVIFAHNLNWFYTIDPKWTEANLLSVLDNDELDDRNALWGGFFWGAGTSNQKLFLLMKPNLLTLAKEHSVSHRGHSEVLAGTILRGWGSLNEKTGERYVSNGEMRDVLLHADDDFRSQVLWQAKVWSKAKADGTGKNWSDLLPEFLRDVWPRQKAVKTPVISARLCDLAFSNIERFPEMAKIILPLLTAVDRDEILFPRIRESGDNIVDKYPQQFLMILHAILSDDVAAWPYDIEEILQRIGEADDGLKSNEIFLELNRKWNAR